MKAYWKIALFMGVCGFGGSAVIGQPAPDAEAPPAGEAPPPPEAGAPPSPDTGAPAPGGVAAAVSDAEVKQFATAVKAVQALQADAAVPAAEKQEKMAAKVQESGLTPTRFNEIAQASQADPALQQRIQAELGQPAR